MPEKQKLWIFVYDLDNDKFRISIFAMTFTISGILKKGLFITSVTKVHGLDNHK